MFLSYVKKVEKASFGLRFALERGGGVGVGSAIKLISSLLKRKNQSSSELHVANYYIIKLQR